VKTLLVSCCFASLALAQEIGTEITPSTPSSGVKPAPATPAPNENPYAQPAPQPAPQPQAQPQQTGGYVYRPQGQKASPAAATANNTANSTAASTASGTRAEPTFLGPKVSASAGDFGIRAGFGASGAVGLPSGSSTTTTTATVSSPSVGISYFATDGFKLIFDAGFGLALVASSGAALWALSANLGFDYLFRSPADALRPLLHFAAQFSMAGSSGEPTVGFGAEIGGGAEYFFSPAFSVYGRIGITVPMAVPGGNFILGLFTFTPGVGASFYF
jgi:hypothetical protein